MRNEEEIQFAHDLLETAIRYGAHSLHEDDVLNMIIMRDTLCWILEHEENTNFSDSIKMIAEHFQGRAN